MTEKYRLIIRKLIPSWLLDPFINTYRFLYALLTSGTGAFAHLSDQHSMWLDIEKYKFNLERELLFEYLTVSGNQDQKTIMMSKERKCHSQNGEDGILLYLFSVIGSTDRRFIEFGAGGKTSNTENLIQNFYWHGLVLDGSREEIDKMNHRYVGLNSTRVGQVLAKQAWITKENVNELFENAGFSGEIDLLSIDIDGNDYWIWEAIHVIEPRVVVIEYNASLGLDSLTIAYNPTHNKFDYHPLGWYHGASLKALTKLADRKGYALVCCDSMGVNAFFVKTSLLKGGLSELDVEEAFYSHKRRDAVASRQKQYEEIRSFNYVEV